MVGEVASALAAAHNNLELVHRDIKPSNVRILSDGSVRLLDFGIARSPRVEREGHTTTGMIVGTPGYLAPERISHALDGPASDVYSLGCVLYAAIAWLPLFHEVPRSRMLSIALDHETHDDFIAERFALLPSGPDTRLLRGMLSAVANRRPSAARIEELCEDIAPELPGASLRRWARARSWRAPREVDGALVGQDLWEEAARGLSVPPSGFPQAATVPDNSTTMVPAPTERPDPPSAPRAESQRPTPRYAEPLPEPSAEASVERAPPVPASTPRPDSGSVRAKTTAPRSQADAASLAPGSHSGERVLAARASRADSGGAGGGPVLAGLFGALVLVAGVLWVAASQGALGQDAQEKVDAIERDLKHLAGAR
jgi:serine/threonine protein kinase